MLMTSYLCVVAWPLPFLRLLPQLEEECEGQCVTVCVSDSTSRLELYTPELLFLQQPLEAPVRTSDSSTQAHFLIRALGVALSLCVCVWVRGRKRERLFMSIHFLIHLLKGLEMSQPGFIFCPEPSSEIDVLNWSHYIRWKNRPRSHHTYIPTIRTHLWDCAAPSFSGEYDWMFWELPVVRLPPHCCLIASYLSLTLIRPVSCSSH